MIATLAVMKGYPITIPTKPYIRHYIEHHYGKMPFLTRDDIFGSKILDLLERPLHQRDKTVGGFPDNLVIVLPVFYMRAHGHDLTLTGIRWFNRFAEMVIKREMHNMLNMLTGAGMKQNEAILRVQDHFGFTEDVFSFESILKSYQRYRVKAGMPYLRNFSEPRVRKICLPNVHSFSQQKISAHG